MPITKASASNNHFVATASNGWIATGRDFTVMCWVRVTTDPGTASIWHSILGSYIDASNGWGLYFNGNLIFQFIRGSGGTFTTSAQAGNVVLSTWYHVAATYKQSTGSAQVFVNGQPGSAVAGAALPTTGSAVFKIGVNDDNPVGIAGQIGYVRIFEGVLSQAEIIAEMPSPVPLNKRFACSFNIPLDNHMGISSCHSVDRSFRGQHVTTVTGTVTWAFPPIPPPPVQIEREPAIMLDRPYLWGAGSAGTIVNVVQVTESGTVQPLSTPSKSLGIQQIVGSSVIQSISSIKSLAVPQINEVSTVQPLTVAKSLLIPQVTEIGLSQAMLVSPIKVNVSQVTEAGTVQPMTFTKALAISQITETGLAQIISGQKTRTIIQITEAGVVQVLNTPAKSLSISQIVETGIAQPISGQKTLLISQISEVGSVFPVSLAKNLGISGVVESGTVFTITPTLAGGGLSVNVDQVTESGMVQIISSLKSIPVSQITEAGIIQTLSVLKSLGITQISEVGTVQPLGWIKTITLQQIIESGLVQSISSIKQIPIVEVTESGFIQAIQVSKTLLPVFESGTVFVITPTGGIPPVPGGGEGAYISPLWMDILGLRLKRR